MFVFNCEKVVRAFAYFLGQEDMILAHRIVLCICQFRRDSVVSIAVMRAASHSSVGLLTAYYLSKHITVTLV